MCDIKGDIYVYTLPKNRYTKLNEKIEEFKDDLEMKNKYELWKRQEELMELYEVKTYLSDVGFIINNDKITNYKERIKEITLRLREDGVTNNNYINEVNYIIKRFYELNK